MDNNLFPLKIVKYIDNEALAPFMENYLLTTASNDVLMTEVNISDEYLQEINTYVKSLEEKLAEYRGMLKKLEWSVIANWGNSRRCPVCREMQTDGHKKSCELTALLKSEEKELNKQ